jgi:hypothetical protein
LRTRIVEFLTQVYQTFSKEISDAFAESEIYNRLLFFFEHYPFHNVLHMKTTEIICLALEKNFDKTIDHLLYHTNLIKSILDISKDKAEYTFEDTGMKSSNGFMAFVRKIANKLIEMQKKNTEVNNCLESIPEWGEYYDNDLKIKNLIESKPLASDPRKKGAISNDDDLEFFFRIKSNSSKNKPSQ